MKQILIILYTWLIILSPVFIPVISAEEITPTPTEIQITPTPTTENTIITGDAEAEAKTDTTVNTNETVVPGLITSDSSCIPPEGQTECPNDIGIGNSNNAEVTTGTGVSAGTGDNLSNGSEGDALIISGDATASGLVDTEINTNQVNLDPSGNVTPTIDNSEGTEEESKTLTVDNNNQVTASNTANASAQTGNNLSADNLGDVKIETGDALALVNMINFLNTNIVGSNFQVMVLDLVNSGNSNIDLNDLWKQIAAGQGGDSLQLAEGTIFYNLQMYINNNNNANLTNNVNVSAGTGENKANTSQNAEVTTGDATALANIANVVNTNIVGSNFYFGIINLLYTQGGDLILPAPKNFESESGTESTGSELSFNNSNQATVVGSASVTASSGENTSLANGGDNTTITGNATASVNNMSIVNLNLFYNNWFFLVINNMGNWTGSVMNWGTPGSIEQQNDLNGYYMTGQGSSAGNNVGSLAVENTNQANIQTNLNVEAKTSGNSAVGNSGDATIKTGNAMAGGNIFNLVNTNLIGGNWFFGILNIAGNWSGNVVFAYPDVTIGLSDCPDELSPGEEFNCQMYFRNQGYEVARGVDLRLELPKGVNWIENEPIWEVGDLKPGQEGSMAVKLRIDENFDFESNLSFWSKFIPKARAESEKAKEIVLQAIINTPDTESNTNNNSMTMNSVVYESKQVESETIKGTPILTIEAQNNVNEFVRPGDIVTFEIKIQNIGDGPADNVVVTQNLFNGAPETFGTFKFDLGRIEPGEGGKLSFGLTLPNDGTLPEDDYRTFTLASGKTLQGNKIESNSARTDFAIKYFKSLIVPEVQAWDGIVLGETTEELDEIAWTQNNNQQYLAYALLILSLLLVLKIMLKKIRNRYFLLQNNLPLA